MHALQSYECITASNWANNAKLDCIITKYDPGLHAKCYANVGQVERNSVILHHTNTIEKHHTSVIFRYYVMLSQNMSSFLASHS